MRREGKGDHEEAAGLVSRLEAIHRMYSDLMKLRVGTNVVEAEMWRMTHEKLSGPTGHRLIVNDRECDKQCETEQNSDETPECSLTQCWRNPSLVRRLLVLRRREVNTQLKKAKLILKSTMKRLTAVSTRSESSQAWLEVRQTMSEVWAVEHRRLQLKMIHLEKKSLCCEKHTMCRKLDKLWSQRSAKKSHCPADAVDFVTQGLQSAGGDVVGSADPGGEVVVKSHCPADAVNFVTGGLQPAGGDVVGNADPGGEVVVECDKIEDWIEDLVVEKSALKVNAVKDVVLPKDDPDHVQLVVGEVPEGTAHPVDDQVLAGSKAVESGVLLLPKPPPVDPMWTTFMSREEDKRTLDRQQEELLNKVLEHNKSWSRKKTQEVTGDSTEAEEEDSDVVVWGDVKITPDERDLLSLGPGYMVVSKLDKDEMLIEENATMTKIRWAKRKTGTEGMTAKEERDNPDVMTEEEISLMEALDKASWDVLSELGDQLDMRKKCATDMRGNRSVYMPGPEKPLVEAENSTRMQVWDKAFNDFATENCDKDGEQKTSNLTRNQKLALKTLSRKVAKLEVIVLEADKGKKFVLVDEATYKKMAEDHTSGDSLVDKQGVRLSQRTLYTMAKSLANIFSLGTSQSQRNYGRCMGLRLRMFRI